MKKRILLALVVAPMLVLAAPLASAQTTDNAGPPASGRGYRMGPGMMGGYGTGAWQQGGAGTGDGPIYGPGGWGMGPGMMGGWGGYGMGPGMMGGWGGYGMGPGMMGGWGGYGMGPGMMGGYNFGPGTWNPALLASLKLSDAQIQKIETIQDAAAKKQWALMTSMHDAMLSGRHSFDQRSIDVDAVMKTAKAVSDIRLQMLRTQLETQKQVQGVLTTQQQDELRQYWRSGW